MANDGNGGPILVLEDSDEDFDTLEDAFRRARRPGTLVRAKSGDEALGLLQGMGAAPLRPCLVVLDLNTPGLDGRQVLAEIRASRSHRCTPVVVLTTSTNPRDMAGCYAAGANACHVKPVQYPDHLAVVETLLAYWLGSVMLPPSDLQA